MAILVLTLVGTDRAGLVAAVAEVIDAHGGNWEHSELAELAGAFAGVIQVSAPEERLDALRAALDAVPGLITVSVPGEGSGAPGDTSSRRLSFTVLGNDHPGIVHEISAALGSHGVSIDRMRTETRDAAMAGGRLFEATVSAVVPPSVEVAAVIADLERIAAELQVDVAARD
ncbi:glycine cleavage system regulatory protein [Microbacterium sp. SLBN-154]|uniref:glycine cleavage system protein R n=1 Tax=Microbacterium sp. SLBN-154 TaxID=2768458 RepID=UPI001154B928|nr:ACT domain-containing protein [Microbacterium sp. SLBN-154]TQK20305.1 glycine cleavage system regulatory protein [Microbacterium sp. SLBN-154]